MSSFFSQSDRIVLEGMRFYGFHGVNPEERVLGQEYLVDLTVEMELGPAGSSDRLEDAISYAHIYRAVREVMEGEPHPPIRGSVIEYATVEIFRRRKDYGKD